MAALLAYADASHVKAPATAFMRPRQLRARLHLLRKEPVMSRTRLVLTLAIGGGALVAAATGVARLLPLEIPVLASGGVAREPPATEAQEPADPQDPDVTLPIPVTRVNPRYTPEAMDAKIEGKVVLTAVVQDDGTVGDVRVTQSLDATYGLDEQAVNALRQWTFRPGRRKGEAVAVQVTVEMIFTLRA
jgi:TonB family protein